MDLFEKYKMTEFTEFPFLPEELRNIDIEPDDLPTINIEAERVFQYVLIRYDIGEAKEFNEFMGYNFLRRKKKTFCYEEFRDKKNAQNSEYINEVPDYIIVLFEPNKHLEDVVKMFHLPSYTKNDTYQFRDLMRKSQMFKVEDFK